MVAPGLAQPPEVSALAALWTLVGHLPDHPLGDLIFAARILRPEPAVLFGDVHHHRARFEDRDRLPAAQRLMVDQGGHAIVGTDFQKSVLELIAAADVDRHDIVGNAELFEQDGHLLAVGRRGVMNIDHGETPSAGVLSPSL